MDHPCNLLYYLIYFCWWKSDLACTRGSGDYGFGKTSLAVLNETKDESTPYKVERKIIHLPKQYI